MPLVALLVCMVAAHGSAQEPEASATQNRIYQESVEQDQLRIQAARLRQDLTALLEEDRQSGASPADGAALRQTIQRLGNLSDREMSAVVQTLRDTGKLQDASGMQNSLVSASNEQRDIQSTLKTLTDLLTLHQTLEGVRQRLQALVARQTANLRHAREIIAAGQPLKALPRELQVAAKLCVSEQAALGNEASLLAEALEKAVSIAGNGPSAAVFAATLKLGEELHLAQQALAAAADTNTRDLTKAPDSQQAMLTTLQAMAAKMASGQSVSERLRESASRLRDLARQQQELADSTSAAGPAAAAALRDGQRQLADQAAVLEAEVAALDARAAGQIGTGEQALRAVDGLLKNPGALKPARGKPGDPVNPATTRAQIAEAQAEAKRQFEAVSGLLSAQADALRDGTKPPPADAAKATAALQQLQQQVGQALAQQQAISGQPGLPASAAQQQQLAAAVATLQRQALPLDTDAASTLGQAAGQMQQAGSTQTPQAAAQAATALLARAQTQLQSKTRAAESAAAAQQSLQALLSLLTGAKAQVLEAARIIMQTAIDDLTPALQQTASAEAGIQQALGLLARGAGAPLPGAIKDDLNAARTDLAFSRLQAAQVQRTPALSANQRAQKELDAAIDLAQRASAQLLAQALPSSALAQSQSQAAQAEQPPGSQSAAPPPANPTQSSPSSSQASAGQPSAGQPPSPGQRQASAAPEPGRNQPAGQAQPTNPQPSGNPPASGQSQAAQDDDHTDSGQAANGPGSGNTKNERLLSSFGAATGYTVVNGRTVSKERDAVAVFQNEKVPSEYSEMVQQYSKNLAEGQSPGK